MIWVAAMATFGVVFVLTYWAAVKLLERRVSVMERIGGGAVPWTFVRDINGDLVSVPVTNDAP